MTPDPRRILLVRLSHLGDVLSALPVFHALRARHPAAEIGWVVQPEFEDLLAGLPGLDRVFRFERRGGWRAWPRLRRELRAFGADLAVDCQSNLKSAGATLCSGAPRRAGLHARDWRERVGAFALNDPARPLGDARPHFARAMLHLARHVAPAGGEPPRFDPSVTEAELERGRALADEHLPPGPAPVVLLVPPPADVRSWPEERWEELARSLARSGAPVLVLSGPAERDVGERLRLRLAGERVGHWIGQRGLRDLAAFFRAAAERGARVVSCDSGPMHLAAACGLPVVTLDGPQDAERTGPWPRTTPDAGSPHRSVRAEDPPACAPCFARRCRHPSGPVCMSRIGERSVLRALREPG